MNTVERGRHFNTLSLRNNPRLLTLKCHNSPPAQLQRRNANVKTLLHGADRAHVLPALHARKPHYTCCPCKTSVTRTTSTQTSLHLLSLQDTHPLHVSDTHDFNSTRVWAGKIGTLRFLLSIEWPRGLRHEPSSLGIPLKAWMSVCVYSVFALPCV
jgi:hypothetical protein